MTRIDHRETPSRETLRGDLYDPGDREPSSGPPRWVSALIIVVAVLGLLGFFALHLAGGLGPGMHGG